MQSTHLVWLEKLGNSRLDWTTLPAPSAGLCADTAGQPPPCTSQVSCGRAHRDGHNSQVDTSHPPKVESEGRFLICSTLTWKLCVQRGIIWFPAQWPTGTPWHQAHSRSAADSSYKGKKKSNCPKLLIITKLHVFVFFRTKAFYCILHHHSNLGINRIHWAMMHSWLWYLSSLQHSI